MSMDDCPEIPEPTGSRTEGSIVGTISFFRVIRSTVGRTWEIESVGTYV